MMREFGGQVGVILAVGEVGEDSAEYGAHKDVLPVV